ncbi:hypothetical protein [Streptomyces sp. HB2AG]|uniref:hypothetical protein n=1 Tax=Streptomyces sp. HB2AG TaxID=2983400 RepID=UPI0022AA355E|nr:hypothetical protein [Streptomyces sp. HB2AG]MCZ2526988.1 hypothetical protein [Streptomyces sp. HB2AG]
MTYYSEVKFLEDCNPAMIERNAAEYKRMRDLLESVVPSVKKAKDDTEWVSPSRAHYDARLRDVDGLVTGLSDGFEKAWKALLRYADAVETAKSHFDNGVHCQEELAKVIAREAMPITRTAQEAEPMRQWEDLRGTTGILDFLAELTVDVDAIMDEANRWHQQTSEAFERALKTEEPARDKCVAALQEAYETLPDFRGNFKDAAALLERVDALQQEARQAAGDPNTHLPGSGPKTDGIPKVGPDVLVSQQLMRIQELCKGLPEGTNNNYWLTSESDADRREWIKANKDIIAAAARESGLPPAMLAGIAWQEIGGKGRVWDDGAGLARGIADQGWFPVTPENLLPDRLAGSPDETSYGPMSIQVRRAAEVLGYDPANLTEPQRDQVVQALEDPAQNVFIASEYLAQVKAESEFADVPADQMTPEQYQELASRYNGGPGWQYDEAQAYGRGFMNDLDEAKQAMK